MKRRLGLALGLLVCSLATAAEEITLPAAPWAVTVDGDPREAFLFGADALPVYDAVTGAPDGSVRAYALACPGGLYVALLSTEPDRGAGLLRPLPWTPPEEVVLGDWMAVRVGPPESAALFVLAPGGYRTVLSGDGLPVSAPPWEGADRLFGATWTGEWLLPWLKGPGSPLRVEVLRGRKIRGGRHAQESLGHSSPGPASWRWGGEGRDLRPAPDPPKAETGPRALAPYDTRPWIPPGEGASACEDAAPSGEMVTAWLEVPPGEGRVRAEAGPGFEGVEVFRVDFWWQSGTREEIDAIFPVRVAAGMGDVLVGDRLFPQPPEGFDPAGEPLRLYVRGRIPRLRQGQAPPRSNGDITVPLKIFRDGHLLGTIPWRVTAAPALPPPSRLAAVYYLEKEPSRWEADLLNLAAHGITAATCPASEAEGWRRFQKAAEASGVDGTWALRPEAVPEGETAWGYACDEPASVGAVEAARTRAAALRARGLKPWAALAWPNSLRLASLLDGVSVPPNLVRAAPGLPAPKRYVYVQGLREDPFFNRVWAGLLCRAPGLSGLWVFCHAPSREGTADDWAGPIIRHDALAAPDGRGGRLDTVPFEALREGILDGRILDALGPRAEAVLSRFPGAAEAIAGEYWKARGRGWTFAQFRRALVEEWERAGGVPGLWEASPDADLHPVGRTHPK
ncbi:MAG: hypothetical protein ACOYXN_10155 [Acidobacteriota bacterium]